MDIGCLRFGDLKEKKLQLYFLEVPFEGNSLWHKVISSKYVKEGEWFTVDKKNNKWEMLLEFYL